MPPRMGYTRNRDRSVECRSRCRESSGRAHRVGLDIGLVTVTGSSVQASRAVISTVSNATSRPRFRRYRALRFARGRRRPHVPRDPALATPWSRLERADALPGSGLRWLTTSSTVRGDGLGTSCGNTCKSLPLRLAVAIASAPDRAPVVTTAAWCHRSQRRESGRALPTYALLVLAVTCCIGSPRLLRGRDRGDLFALLLLGIPPILTNAYVGMLEVDRDLVEPQAWHRAVPGVAPASSFPLRSHSSWPVSAPPRWALWRRPRCVLDRYDTLARPSRRDRGATTCRFLGASSSPRSRARRDRLAGVHGCSCRPDCASRPGAGRTGSRGWGRAR